MNASKTDADSELTKRCPQCGAALQFRELEGLCPACLLEQGALETSVESEAGAFVPPDIEEIRRLFPQLEIIALIGRGGMGAVYKARQLSLDRLVALKMLPSRAAETPGFAERFNREARALAKLNHPNIVAIHDFGQAQGLPYFIMEFVDGLNLRQLERSGELSPREALKIVPQICEALQFAHEAGIVHRDIKPENILISNKSHVKIADFGIAKIMDVPRGSIATDAESVMGTPHYMAPEQVETPGTVDHRADIFSVGVVFYEMLTGALPLGKFEPPSSVKVDVDIRFDRVVLRALEKDRERRYQNAGHVKQAVDTLAGEVAFKSDSKAETRETVIGKNSKFAVGVAAAGILIVLLASLIVLRRSNSQAAPDPSIPSAAKPSVSSTPSAHEDFTARLEAATLLIDVKKKDHNLSVIALDAAKLRDLEIIGNCLRMITEPKEHDRAASDTARVLASEGARQPAIEIAKTIIDPALQDQLLTELSR